MNAAIYSLQSQADRRAVVSAYRRLYRQGLKVINYSTPSRYVLLKILRSSFRASPIEAFDMGKIENTLRFLQRATVMLGIEHKIVRNLLMVRYWEQPLMRKDHRVLRTFGLGHKEMAIRNDAIKQFNLTLMLLNESLGTCLR